MSHIAKLERDVENLVKTGERLDAKKRKDRLTFSEKDRELLIKKETKLLKTITALFGTAAGIAAVYAVFTKRSDLSKKMIDLTKALGSKLNPSATRVAEKLPPPSASPIKMPGFLRYLVKVAKHVGKTHVEAWRYFFP
jgi:small-conductance mechanosensitive channel